MSDFCCPKKSMFHCAWCNSANTYITMKNTNNGMKKVIDYDNYDHEHYGYEHKFPNGLLPYPFPPKSDPKEMIDHSRPFFVIIKCDDCDRYSSVKSVFCKMCHHHDVIVKKIYDKIHPDDLFDMTPLKDYVCKFCKHHKPEPYCEHSWIRVSGEIFSECTVSNLVCKKCGKKKTTYSNQDTYLNPWASDDFSYKY